MREHNDRRHFLRTAAMTVGATGLGVITSAYAQAGTTKAAAQLSTEDQMPSLGRVSKWLDSAYNGRPAWKGAPFSGGMRHAFIGKGLGAYVAVDASGTFSETKRLVGLLRMLQAGVIVSDYGTLMVGILKDNARPEAGAVYGAIDMPWAKLVGQIAQAYGK